MEKWLSRKIKFMSFVFMIGVVVLHANLISDSHGMLLYFQIFITEGLTRIAVPAFFAISGFFLMYNFKGEYYTFFTRKIKSRVKSLLFPFIIWTLIGLAIAFTIQRIGYWPMDKRYGANFHTIIEEILHPTIVFQLWFVRDLFIFVLLSPIFYLLLKYLHWGWLLLIFIGSFFTWHLFFLQVDDILFFCLGMYVAMYHKNWLLIRWNHKKNLLVGIILSFLGLCILITFGIIPYPIWTLKNLLGIIAVWGVYDIGNYKFSSSKADAILSLSFFLFLFHEPLLSVIQKILIKLLDHNGDVTIAIAYIFSPILTIIISLFVGLMSKLKFPKVYGILTGGR